MEFRSMRAVLKRFATRTGLSVLLLTLGTGVVYLPHLGMRSLWHDEAWVANAVLEPSLSDMYTKWLPLTPPLFMLGLRTAVAVLGSSEAALRLLPAAFALAAVPLLFLLVRRLRANRAVAFFAAIMCGFAPIELRYARELKQFSADVACAVLLFLLAEVFVSRRTRRTLLVLSITASVAVWFSHSAVIAVATVLLRLTWEAVIATGANGGAEQSRNRVGGWIGAIALLAGSAGASFLIQYRWFLVKAMAHPLFGQHWNKFYLVAWPPEALFRGIGLRTIDLLRYCLSYRHGWTEFLALLVVIGVARAIAARERSWIVYIVGPVLVTIILALLGRYPFGGIRANLFLLPSLCLAAASALVWVTGFRSLPGRLASGLVIVLALVLAGDTVWMDSVNPYRREELRGLIASYLQRRQPGDYTYVYYGAEYAFRYYTRESFGDRIILGVKGRRKPAKYERQIDELVAGRGPTRFWVVFSHFGIYTEEKDIIKDSFKRYCRRLDRLVDYGAEIALFGCGGRDSAPSVSPRPPATDP